MPKYHILINLINRCRIYVVDSNVHVTCVVVIIPSSPFVTLRVIQRMPLVAQELLDIPEYRGSLPRLVRFVQLLASSPCSVLLVIVCLFVLLVFGHCIVFLQCSDSWVSPNYFQHKKHVFYSKQIDSLRIYNTHSVFIPTFTNQR